MKTKFLRNILVILFLVVHYNSFSQTADHWESIIIEGDSCKYIVPDSEISNWHLKDFNDSAFPPGLALYTGNHPVAGHCAHCLPWGYEDVTLSRLLDNYKAISVFVRLKVP